jgi:hypothetical protein
MWYVVFRVMADHSCPPASLRRARGQGSRVRLGPLLTSPISISYRAEIYTRVVHTHNPSLVPFCKFLVEQSRSGHKTRSYPGRVIPHTSAGFYADMRYPEHNNSHARESEKPPWQPIPILKSCLCMKVCASGPAAAAAASAALKQSTINNAESLCYEKDQEPWVGRYSS